MVEQPRPMRVHGQDRFLLGELWAELMAGKMVKFIAGNNTLVTWHSAICIVSNIETGTIKPRDENP